MNFDLNQASNELLTIEKKMLDLDKLGFESSYEHWTLLNTINHVYSWKTGALKKVELKLSGKEAKYKSDESLDILNHKYYKETCNYSKRKTIEVMNEVNQKIRSINDKIKDRGSSKELAPKGFNGTVFEYLKYDLIYHPINHYVFYAIKNSEYDIFIVLEKYIQDRRSTIFSDLGIMNLKELINENETGKVFNKGYEWEQDELYNQIKTMTA
jgi:hypothetical protein